MYHVRLFIELTVLTFTEKTINLHFFKQAFRQTERKVNTCYYTVKTPL